MLWTVLLLVPVLAIPMDPSVNIHSKVLMRRDEQLADDHKFAVFGTLFNQIHGLSLLDEVKQQQE
jgi:hypothetical protein